MYQNLFWAGASLWTPLRCLQSSSHPNFVVGWREGCFLLIAFASTTAFTILIYRCFHGTAPPYLMDSCALTAEVTGRQHLRSATQRKLVVPRYRLNSFGCRRFSVAGPSTWNSLPDSLRYPELSFDIFKRQLKTFIFAKYWWQNVLSALEIFLSMRYINLHFTYLLTYYSRSSILTFLRNSSPVLVMISSMSVPTCNHFHGRRANGGKIASF